MPYVLEVNGLSKKYPKKDVFAVNKISFNVDEGEIFALIGPNGAGKTTTIRMLSTLIQVTEGDALVAGHSVVKEADKVRRNITYLPDEAGAYKTMTGHHYLEFMAGLFAANKDELYKFTARAEAICGLGTRLNDKIGGYSRGMVRKLLLARAVMTAPKLAIMDEATSGLDVINALEIRKMIKNLAREQNMSFLLSSHNMLEIEYVSDRVGIITNGKLMTVGKVEELKNKYSAANLEEVFEKVVLEEKEGGADEIR
ncbi:MAG: ABC transporter ATP-binding protein [Oscillospiraceae bacterium]|nr:ABC transporter ATP-binding protein [Oscillospiraceae bacterium]